jgi:hypothetical protein
MADQVVFFRVEAQGVGDLVDQLGLLRKQASELQKEMRKATDPAEYTKLNRELENNKNAQKAVREEVRNVEKAQKEQQQFAKGSYLELNKQLIELKKTFRSLSEVERDSAFGQNTVRQIEALDTQLKELDASIGQYQRNVGNYESAFSGFAGTLLQIGAVAEVAQFFDPNALIAQGIAIENLDKKAQTVFGSTLPRVTQEAEKNAAAMGLTTREYINAAAQIQDLLVPMGFTRDAAAGISVQLQNLSGALSEWTGGQRSASEVSEILNAALLGERESLKSLGISISEADVTAQLAAKGQEKLTGAALQQAQAQATLDLVLQKSTDAQEAFANGADSPIRQMNLLKAQVTELAEAVATGATPAISGLIQIFLALGDFVQNNKVAFGAAALAVGTYTVAVNASTIATAAAQVAQLALNAAIKAAPYVAIAAAVFALAKVIVDYAYAAEEASVTTKTVAESADRLSNAISSSAVELAKETNAVRANFEVLKSETATRQEKADVIRKLKSEYPDLLKNYDLEKGSLQEIEAAEKSIIRARAEKIAQKVTESEIEALTKSLIDANRQLDTATQKAKEVDAAFAESNKKVDESSVLGFYLSGQFFSRVDIENAKRDSDNALAAAQERIATLQGQIKTVGLGTQAIAGQLTQALNGIPIAAAQAGDATAKALDTGVNEGAEKPIETLQSLRAEFEKVQKQIAGFADKSLIPVDLLNSYKSLEGQIASVEKELADMAAAAAKQNAAQVMMELFVKFRAENEALDALGDDLADRPIELSAEISPNSIKKIEGQMIDLAKASGKAAYESAKAVKDAGKKDEKSAKEDMQKRLDEEKDLREQIKEASIQLAQDASDAIFELEAENAERRLEKRLEEIDQQESEQLALVEGNAIAEQQVLEQFAAQREQLQREEFERKKRMDIAQAIMNGALGVTSALTQVPAGFVMAALVAAQTAIQVATIAAQEFARGGLIEAAVGTPKAESGIFVGPSHAGGGINARLSGRLVNVEGGEFYERMADGSSVVINKRSTARFMRALQSQAGINYPGKLQTLSRINELGGGVPLYATGGLIAPMGNASADRSGGMGMEVLALAIDKMNSRVPVLTLQSFDTVNARANQVRTLQGL